MLLISNKRWKAQTTELTISAVENFDLKELEHT